MENNPVSEHLKRTWIKAIPTFGGTIEAMTYGTKDVIEREQAAAQQAQDKAKLEAILNSHTTDLGDILNQLRQQNELSEQMQQAIATMTRYYNGNPTAHDIVTVESAAVQQAKEQPDLLPRDLHSVAHYLPTGDVSRDALDKALMKMVDARVDQIIGDIPNAKPLVRMRENKTNRVQDLLDFAESSDGPTLNGLEAYIARRKYLLANPR